MFVIIFIKLGNTYTCTLIIGVLFLNLPCTIISFLYIALLNILNWFKYFQTAILGENICFFFHFCYSTYLCYIGSTFLTIYRLFFILSVILQEISMGFGCVYKKSSTVIHLMDICFFLIISFIKKQRSKASRWLGGPPLN